MEATPGKEDMSFDEWLIYGITRNWSTAPICETHDGFAKTEEEKINADCVHYLRLYKNASQIGNLIDEFPPASWRSYTRKLEWED